MISNQMYTKQSFLALQQRLVEEKILSWIFARLDKRV
jgi:hypothetical protein